MKVDESEGVHSRSSRYSRLLGFTRFIVREGWDMYNPALTANEQGNMAFVCDVSGPNNVGIASLRGSIDGATGGSTSGPDVDH
jgi:hypothetical protein